MKLHNERKIGSIIIKKLVTKLLTTTSMINNFLMLFTVALIWWTLKKVFAEVATCLCFLCGGAWEVWLLFGMFKIVRLCMFTSDF